MNGIAKRMQRPLLIGGLLLTAGALLLAAMRETKPERLPAGWEPVGVELEAALDALERPEPTRSVDGESGSVQVGAGEPDGEADAGAVGAAAGDTGDGTTDDGATEDGSGGAGGFDINRATEAEWDALPGIGPAKARAIVEERERNGSFHGVDDLVRVKGIGPKLVEKLRAAIEGSR